jgi:murein DD-endopeptidase MepM/ murein hydrolase activator NlpD
MRKKFDMPSSSRESQPGPPPALVAAILLLLLAALFLGIDRWRNRSRVPAPPALELARQADPDAPAVPALRGMGFPTPQPNLFEPGWQQGVQPTASGRPESGLYGSYRTGAGGLSSFHEGVDLVAVCRDARGNPTDPAAAVADGRVAYVNRVSGNSNYGQYVVLFHPDPVGTAYTLYAHLASVEPGLAAGQSVARGARLGTVGHSSSSPIPVSRAHLHFEVGLLANDRFAPWCSGIGDKNPHGMFNGRNLLGVDPLAVLADSRNNPDFSLLAHLRSRPVAFSVVARGRGRLPDYFRRHPSLWNGAAACKALVLDCTEGGVPVAGRPATDEEIAKLGRDAGAVLSANEAALGRNGRHLVVHRNDGWQIGRNGEAWLDLLLY